MNMKNLLLLILTVFFVIDMFLYSLTPISFREKFSSF